MTSFANQSMLVLKWMTIVILIVETKAAANTYIVTMPPVIPRRDEFGVLVHILRSDEPVNVTVEILTPDNGTLRAEAVARQGPPTTVSLTFPPDLKPGHYLVVVTGSGGLSFCHQWYLRLEGTALAIFVQTDKGIYQPGQKVLFRVFAVYPNLAPYLGTFNITVRDGRSNKIKQYNQVKGEAGVFAGEITLSDQPVLGSWTIKSEAPYTERSGHAVIAVKEKRVLPWFVVTVDVPAYGHITDAELLGSVEAKYALNRTIQGTVVVRATVRFHRCHRATEKRLQLNGRATFRFSVRELASLAYVCRGRRGPPHPHFNRRLLLNAMVMVEANVTEALTGNVQSGSDAIRFSDKTFKLEWLRSKSGFFSPGLWYDALLRVSMMDGRHIALNGRQMAVTIRLHVRRNLRCINFKKVAKKEFEHFPGIKIPVPADGVIRWSNIIPICSANVVLQASLDGAKDKFLRPWSSNRYLFNHMKARLLTSSPKVGENAELEILCTGPMKSIVYQIISRGRLVRRVMIEGSNRTAVSVDVPVTGDMAPSAKLVVYAVLVSEEILAESVNFDQLASPFKNNVSISWSQARAEPGDEVSIVVQSDPDSLVNLLVTDTSALSFKPYNDFNRDTVINWMEHSYHFASKPRRMRRSLNVWLDNQIAFTNAGVIVMTDAGEPAYGYYRGSESFGRMPSVFQWTERFYGEKKTLPSFSPETWLWASQSASADGRAVFTATVPDTITSWVAGAFAMNTVTGLGVAPTGKQLEVFKPFYVTLEIPARIVRGEEVVIQAIVFNFLPQDLSVNVTLVKSPGFQNMGVGDNDQAEMTSKEVVQVKASGGSSTIFFPIVASSLGSIDLSVRARSAAAADTVVRRLIVESEGVPQEYNIPMLIDLSPPTTSFSQTQQLPFPPNVVPGSEWITASASGDILAPTLGNLENLLKMPLGCGEQNMINFAPNVFVMKYLNATSQLTDSIRDTATRFLEQGYQRELSYQRKDGSFSAFGDRDESGSIWLTALVLKSIWEARPFISIDDVALGRAMEWIISKQEYNGSFREVGNVIHKYMQGGSGTGLALTAFVLCALSGKEDLPVPSRFSIPWTYGILDDPENLPRRSAAITRARSYLETAVSSETDSYSLSVVAYALKVSNSSAADMTFDRLSHLATVKDGVKFWEAPITPKSVTTRRNYWVPPRTTRTPNVEATSYALLNLALRGERIEGLPAVKWLVQQRNSHGGFASTQDTILALEALSEFAELIYNPNSNVDVVVSADSFRQEFNVRQSNALVLQTADIPNRPNSVNISARGSGVATVQISVYFNVFSDSREPTFDIRVNLQDEKLEGFLLQTCVTSRLSGESGSGMVVQEVGLPTGFQADIDSIGKIKGLKRTEILDRKIVLYFDEVTAAPVCVSMRVQRVGLVAKSQAVPVRVFQYYSPENQATVFYESQPLRDSNFCDICADCNC